MFKSQFLNVAYQVLALEKRPMRPKEIIDVALQKGLLPDNFSGKTPYQTMKSKLSVHVKRSAEASIFVRVKAGFFYLRELLHDKNEIFTAKPVIKPKSKERVLVVDENWFESNYRFQGLLSDCNEYLSSLLSSQNLTYKERYAAELDDHHKQILTYVLVTRGNSVLCFKRGNYNRVEDFLRGSLCIGFGGHVIEQDKDLFSSADYGLTSCLLRELSEELTLPDLDKRRLVKREGVEVLGLLNDDSSEVGRRHIAVVFRYEVSNDSRWDHPVRGEKSITQLTWLSPGAAIAPIWNFEYWSQLCLRQFTPELVLQTPAYRVRRKKVLQSQHLLCVLGEVSSGKTLATSLLCQEFGYHEINSGKVLAGLLGLPPVPETSREEIQKAAWEFIKKADGPKKLAKAIIQAANKHPHSKILIDGIRQKATLEALQNEVDKAKLAIIFVHTLPDIAFEFYKLRERRAADVFEFLTVRGADVEREVRSLIALADVVIYNWTGEENFLALIRKVMSSFGGSQ